MQTIRTGFGSRKIEDLNEGVLLGQLRDVLTAHRATLIQRLANDLPTYIHYQFQVKANKPQLDEIREHLQQLKTATVDLDHFPQIVGQVLEQETTFVINEPFYRELNECIGVCLTDSPLKVVK